VPLRVALTKGGPDLRDLPGPDPEVPVASASDLQLVIPQEVCRSYARSSKLEWLEASGDGSYAMGTVAGSRTRRYHGLLVAAQSPPVDRHLLLAGLDELVSQEDSSQPGLALSTQQYPGTLSPQGFLRLLEFRADPCPTWLFDVGGGARLEKQLVLVHGEQTVIVSWRATAPRRLTVLPFLAFRDHHALLRARSPWDGSVREERAGSGLLLRVKPEEGLPELRLFAGPDAQLAHDGAWYYNAEVLEEQARGLDFQEDLWKLGTLTFELAPDRPAFLVATTGTRALAALQPDRPGRKAEQVFSALVEQVVVAEKIRREPRAREPLRRSLERAADKFCVRRQDGRPTVIAGYPWFADWGRDTMISLPGLYLSRGKIFEAREVLRCFLAHLDQGLIPNRFPDRAGDPVEYNTVDATLWMFQAADQLLRAGGGADFLIHEFYPAAREIVSWHQRGTRHGIGVDREDHLLSAGEPGLQLTWMDARVNGQVITPRIGKPVEINALWFNALRLMGRWSDELHHERDAVAYHAEAERVAKSFEQQFWNPARGYLNDVITPEGPDSSLRPNQLFAVSLAYPLLEQGQQQRLVQAVERELLTEVGLRTLSRGDPAYRGQYQGSLEQRDRAYHQGTVWPWLLGPYARAYLTAFGRTPQTRQYCRGLLFGLEARLEGRLEGGCPGQVPEVFDGDLPHLPGGAPAQAWSVAELLEVLRLDED